MDDWTELGSDSTMTKCWDWGQKQLVGCHFTAVRNKRPFLHYRVQKKIQSMISASGSTHNKHATRTNRPAVDQRLRGRQSAVHIPPLFLCLSAPSCPPSFSVSSLIKKISGCSPDPLAGSGCAAAKSCASPPCTTPPPSGRERLAVLPSREPSRRCR